MLKLTSLIVQNTPANNKLFYTDTNIETFTDKQPCFLHDIKDYTWIAYKLTFLTNTYVQHFLSL